MCTIKQLYIFSPSHIFCHGLHMSAATGAPLTADGLIFYPARQLQHPPPPTMWVYKINKYYITPTLSSTHHHILLLAVPFARVAFVSKRSICPRDKARKQIFLDFHKAHAPRNLQTEKARGKGDDSMQPNMGHHHLTGCRSTVVAPLCAT